MNKTELNKDNRDEDVIKHVMMKMVVEMARRQGRMMMVRVIKICSDDLDGSAVNSIKEDVVSDGIDFSASWRACQQTRHISQKSLHREYKQTCNTFTRTVARKEGKKGGFEGGRGKGGTGEVLVRETPERHSSVLGLNDVLQARG